MGMLNGVTFSDEIGTFSTKPRGNSFAGTTEFVLATKLRYAMNLPLASRPALKKCIPSGGTGRAPCRLRASTGA